MVEVSVRTPSPHWAFNFYRFHFYQFFFIFKKKFEKFQKPRHFHLISQNSYPRDTQRGILSPLTPPGRPLGHWPIEFKINKEKSSFGAFFSSSVTQAHAESPPERRTHSLSLSIWLRSAAVRQKSFSPHKMPRTSSRCSTLSIP